MKRGRSALTTTSDSIPYKKARYTTPEARAIRENNSVIRQQRKTQGRVGLKVTHMGDANSVTTSGYIQSLTANMSRGTDAINNYMGNEVLPTSVRVNIGLTIGPSLVANGDGTNFLRILIFQWYDSTLPATSGVLTTSSSPFSMLYWPNRENIKVLADRLVALHQYGLKQDSYDSWCEEIYIKGKNMIPIKFNAAGNGTQKGDIHIDS